MYVQNSPIIQYFVVYFLYILITYYIENNVIISKKNEWQNLFFIPSKYYIHETVSEDHSPTYFQ